MASLDQAVGHDDQVNKPDSDCRQVQEGLLWSRDRQALAEGGSPSLTAIVRADRLKTANANFRERDECARSLRRGIVPDVDTPAREPCCESRILALATDGERQLIIRYHDTRSSQALIDHGHRGHLCRR